MKPVTALKLKDDADTKLIDRAVKEFARLGKTKVHPYGDGAIRFHHRHKYFVYSPWTNKWCFQRSSGMRRWSKADSIEDMLNTINTWMDSKGMP